jgi:hypothetical protein
MDGWRQWRHLFVLSGAARTQDLSHGPRDCTRTSKPVLRPAAAADQLNCHPVATPGPLSPSKTSIAFHSSRCRCHFMAGRSYSDYLCISSCYSWYCKYWTPITTSTSPPRRPRQRGICQNCLCSPTPLRSYWEYPVRYRSIQALSPIPVLATRYSC